MKGEANLDARYAVMGEWIDTELYCPFCAARCNKDDGAGRNDSGVQMKAGINGNNLYRCAVCGEEFYLDVVEMNP